MDIKVNYIQKLNKEGSKLLGFASITVDNLFTINNIAVLVGQERERFISMPSYKGKDDEFHDLVVFSKDALSSGVKKYITKAILNAYDKPMSKKTSVSEDLDKEKALKNAKKVNIFVRKNKYVSLNYNEMYFSGCQLKESEKGMFLSNPCRIYNTDGEIKYRDIFYIPCDEAKSLIQKTAKIKYEQYFNKENTQTSPVEDNTIDSTEDEEEAEDLTL